MSFKNERFLIEAIEQCHLHKILTCIKHGHNINIQNDLGQNLLIHLIKQQNPHDPLFERKRLNIFQFLITHCNLDIHLFDYYGKNLFNWITNLNCTQEALYLLRSYPGDINILIRDYSGLCSLHYAIEHGNEILVRAIVDYLLQYRIRFDIPDNHNNTPDELARKLGYEQLSGYLAETSRSTIFMAREIPVVHQMPFLRPMTNKSKATTVSSSTLSNSSISTETLDVYHVLESKIEIAKKMNDWKTVRLLRAYQRNPNGKKLNQLPIPTLQINRTIQTPLPSLTPIKTSPINPLSKTLTGGQTAQMLRLLEPQLTSSYRQAFVPYYQRPVVPVVGLLPPASVSQRKLSIVSTTSASSRRMSSVLGLRRRESNVSQLGLVPPQDLQNRLSLPPVFKQQQQPRPSISMNRLSDGDALTKLRSKNLITIEN